MKCHVLGFCLLGVLALSGCGSTGEVVTVTKSDPAAAPAQDEQVTTPTETESGGRDIRIGTVGGPALTDGSMTVQVNSLEATRSKVPNNPYSDQITPVGGAKLVVAEVIVLNDGRKSISPFCGGSGSTLVDDSERNYDQDTRTNDVAGNDICIDDIQPGFKKTYKLLYQIPLEAKVDSIAIWDTDEESDYFGKTVIQFAKPR